MPSGELGKNCPTGWNASHVRETDQAYETLDLSSDATNAASNMHLRNNLLLGQGTQPRVFALDTFTNYSTSDYNGFRPNPGSKDAFAWNSPPFEVVRDFYEGHKAAAMKAVELDDTLAEGHSALGVVKLRDYDWPGAEQEFRRAIALNPSYAQAHQWLAMFLAGIGPGYWRREVRAER